MTAAQRVLSTPELVAEIFTYLEKDTCAVQAGFGNYIRWEYHSTLLRCARVSPLWCAEAMRHFWRHPKATWYRNTLTHRFELLDPTRRQYYANFVIEGSLDIVYRKNLRQVNDVFRFVTFPKLRRLHISVDNCQPKIHLPKIDAPALTVLQIEVACIHGRLRVQHHLHPRVVMNIPRHITVCLLFILT